MNSDIVEKLRKMLNLAKSANQNEADLAMEKAIALAAKYEIDLAVINMDGGKVQKEEMVRNDKQMGKRFPVTQEYVSRILIDFFKVKIIYSGCRDTGRKIIFLGRKSDVEFALYVQDFLNEHMMRSWQYYQQARNVATAYRATFFLAFKQALAAKLEKAKKNEVDNTISEVVDIAKREQVKTSYALTIQDDKKELESFEAKMFPQLRKAPRSNKTYFASSDAAVAGFRYGDATNINRPIQ